MASWRWEHGYGPEALWHLADVGSENPFAKPGKVVVGSVTYDSGSDGNCAVLVEGDRFENAIKINDSGIAAAMERPMVTAHAPELVFQIDSTSPEFCSFGDNAYQGRLLRKVLVFMTRLLGVGPVGVHVPTRKDRENMPLVFAAKQPSTGAQCRGLVMAMRGEREEFGAVSLGHLLSPDLSAFERERRAFYDAVGGEP